MHKSITFWNFQKISFLFNSYPERVDKTTAQFCISRTVKNSFENRFGLDCITTHIKKTTQILESFFCIKKSGRRDLNPRPFPWQGNALPLSYSRIWCRGRESNSRHHDFQSCALPLSYPGKVLA